MKVLAGLYSLPPSERMLIFRLASYIVRTEIALNLLPYSVARKLVFKQKPIRRSPPTEPVNILYMHLKLMRRLCRNLPWTVTCLRQAVALRDSLAADGVEAVLKIGMCRDRDKLAAHAWLECCNLEVLKNGTYCELKSTKWGVRDGK